MAIENKRLKFILDMVDKVTGPSQKATKSLKGLGAKVTETQKQIGDLQSKTNDIQSLQNMQKGLRDGAVRSQELSDKQIRVVAALDASKVAQKLSAAELKKAEAALKRATLSGGQNAHVVAQQTDRVERLRKVHEVNRQTTTKYKTELSGLKKETTAHTRQIDLQQKGVDDLVRKLQAAGINTNRLGSETRRMASEQARATEEVNKHQRALEAATRKQQQMTDAKERYNRAMELSDKVAKTGAGLSVAGGVIAGGSIKAASVYKDFAAQMSAVQATGDLDDGARKRLAKLARLEASKSAFGATEAASAQEYLAMAGFNEQAITDSLRGVLNLASATKTGLAETADIGSNILSGFGLDPDEMGRVADVLTKVTSTANTNLTELGGAMKYVAPVAKSAGYEIESVAAAAGMMANVGIKDSQAGTALRASILRMASLPKAARKAFGELGVEVKDAQGNMRGLEYVLADVAKAMEGMGSAERLQKLSHMFGVEASAGLAELLDKSTGDELLAYIEKLKGAEGATDKAAATRLNNLDGDLKLMASGWEEIRLKYGEALDPVFRGVIQSVTKVITKLDDWMAKHPTLIKALGVLATAFGLLLGALGAVLLVMAPFIMAWAKWRLVMFFAPIVMKQIAVAAGLLVKAVVFLTMTVLRNIVVWGFLAARFALVTSYIVAKVAILGTLRAAMLVATAAQWAFNAALTANPIGLLIAGIAALIAAGVYLYTHWDEVKAWCLSLWDTLKATFNDGVAWIMAVLSMSPMEILESVWGAVSDFFSNLWGNVSDMASNALSGIVDRLKGLAAWVGSGFGLFGGDEELTATVNEAPKKAPDTGAVATPKTLKQGNQIKQAAPVTNIRTTVSPTIHVTASPGMDTKAVAQEVARQIEAMQRRADQQNRARLGD
ncbi:MAG: phage tail tape measure protein [Aeromonadaceae bacterium]